jgi:hypothetical protein
MSGARFLTISTTYIPNGECWLLISDYNWYLDHSAAIRKWSDECLEGGYNTEGMTVKFKSDEDRTLFLLRWAND